MSDLTDVLNALANLATTAIYPNGTSQPSIVGTQVTVGYGWPIPAVLDASLAAGNAWVTIYPTTMERNTTRFATDWQESSINLPTLTLTVSGNTLTVGGTVSTPQTCMIILNGNGYAYSVQANDTLTMIASGIAALISGAISSGTVVTIPSAHTLTANISTMGTSIRELKRQERVFMITVWAPSEVIRTTLASAIDVLFAANERFTLPDNCSARLKYHNSRMSDEVEKEILFRRDLLYSVEYATTQTQTNYTIANSYINTLAAGQTGQINP